MLSPKVSVCMITYNHEKFIAQAIDSVLMQQTNFDYELVIGEDCSTDGTGAIVADYQKRYPERIRAFLREKNIGMHENGRQTLAACRGEYIAILEGDDYWTDQHKLQKQVDHLDAHPEASVCFHNVSVLGQKKDEVARLTWCPDDLPRIIEFRELLKHDPVPGCAWMCRRAMLPPIPDCLSSVLMGDWATLLLLAQNGPLHYLPEIMGVYRIHAGGVHSQFDQVARDECCVDFYRQIESCFRPYRNDIRRYRAFRHLDLIRHYLKTGSQAACKSHFCGFLATYPNIRDAFPLRALLWLALQIYAPRCYRAGRAVFGWYIPETFRRFRALVR